MISGKEIFYMFDFNDVNGGRGLISDGSLFYSVYFVSPCIKLSKLINSFSFSVSSSFYLSSYFSTSTNPVN